MYVVTTQPDPHTLITSKISKHKNVGFEKLFNLLSITTETCTNLNVKKRVGHSCKTCAKGISTIYHRSSKRNLYFSKIELLSRTGKEIRILNVIVGIKKKVYTEVCTKIRF